MKRYSSYVSISLYLCLYVFGVHRGAKFQSQTEVTTLLLKSPTLMVTVHHFAYLLGCHDLWEICHYALQHSYSKSTQLYSNTLQPHVTTLVRFRRHLSVPVSVSVSLSYWLNVFDSLSLFFVSAGEVPSRCYEFLQDKKDHLDCCYRKYLFLLFWFILHFYSMKSVWCDVGCWVVRSAVMKIGFSRTIRSDRRLLMGLYTSLDVLALRTLYRTVSVPCLLIFHSLSIFTFLSMSWAVKVKVKADDVHYICYSWYSSQSTWRHS